MATPEKFVLKPQREGGGNNVYGEDIKPFLENIKTIQDVGILMDSLVTRNCMVKPGRDQILNDVTFSVGRRWLRWLGWWRSCLDPHNRLPSWQTPAGDISPEDFTEAPVESWTDNMVFLHIQPQFLKVSKIIYQSINDDFVCPPQYDLSWQDN